MLTIFLETYMKLLLDSKVVKGLQELVNNCASKEGAPEGHYAVRKIAKHKTRIGCEMKLTAQIGDYYFVN